MAVESEAVAEGRPAWLEKETNFERVVKFLVKEDKLPDSSL